MDIKSRKFVLFAMIVNKVYNPQIKFTYLKIVNLEMFTSVCTNVYILIRYLSDFTFYCNLQKINNAVRSTHKLHKFKYIN